MALGPEDGDGVGADAEVGGVAEGREPGVAQQEVQAHGQDGEDQRLGEQSERVRGQQRRPRRHQPDDDAYDEDAPSHQARPKSPVGRSARISAMGAKSVKYDSSGKSALP